MCDLAPIFALLTVGEIAIIVAIVACGVAIALNLSVFGAGGAPIAFGISLASALVASLALAPATGMLANCGATACLTAQNGAAGWLAAITGTLASGIAMAYIAIFIAGTPFIGAGAMGFYLAFLVAAAAMLTPAVNSLRTLLACMSVPPPATDGAANALAGVAAFIAVIVIIAVLILGGRSKDSKDPKEPKDPNP
jgi:hypothetical protein